MPSNTLSLSVIIPVFNEVKTINDVFKRTSGNKLVSEIVIVDDGSRDGTVKILQGLDNELRQNPSKYNCSVKIIYHEKNRGKGAAVRTGLANVSGDIVIIQDADLELCPEEYDKLIAPITAGKTDVVYGSRFLKTIREPTSFSFHTIGNRILTLATNLILNIRITDMETCYKVMRPTVAKGLFLKSERFGIEPEITAKLARFGYKIYEVPITYKGRSRKEGKKIGWKDAIEAIWVLVKSRYF